MSELGININNSLFSIDSIIQNILPYYNLKDPKVTIIKFKDTDKQRAVYKIDSENKSYCFKKVYYSTEDLLFIYSALEWLHRNGLNIPTLIPTISGGRFVLYKKMLFILTPWINGIRCDFDNKNHIISAAIELGKIHKNSFNFMPIIGSSNRESLGRFYISILKHFEQLLQTSSYAFITKDKFSKEFLSTFDKNLKLAEISLKISSTINNDNLSISLCHGDYVGKNLIIDNDEKLHIIDFDKCKKDYCAHDVSYFLRRYLKRDHTKWNIDYALCFLKYYNSINPLTTSDLKYILSYLSFPQKYWKVSKDYYKDKNRFDTKIYQSILIKSNKHINEQYLLINKLINIFEKNNWNINLI